MLTARPMSLLIGRNVVGNAARLRLNDICSHAHQSIGLEWRVGVATQELLPQDPYWVGNGGDAGSMVYL